MFICIWLTNYKYMLLFTNNISNAHHGHHNLQQLLTVLKGQIANLKVNHCMTENAAERVKITTDLEIN